MTHVPCARGHGPLRRFVPATLDGRAVEVGGCARCGGMWIPVAAIRALFPLGLLTYFSEQGYLDEGPRCPVCTQSPPMRQQRFEGVEIDRCLYCLGLWLDGGELVALGGGAEGAAKYASCDVCGVGIPASDAAGAQGGLGSLCRVCRHAQVLDQDPAHTHPALKALPEGTSRRLVDGASVQFAWDVDDADGEETLFEFRGELPDSRVRGSITHENRMTRMFRSLGVPDVEIGDQAFDGRFLVKAEATEPMQAWLGSEGVADALVRLDALGGCTVRVDRGVVTIVGEQPHGFAVPNPDVETTCIEVYRGLRSVG